MKRLKALIIGMLLATVAAIITAQRYSEANLQEKNRILLAQRDYLSALVEGNARSSNASVEGKRPETELDESARELLRLRGEVVRLHQSEDELEKLRSEKEKLRQEIGLLRVPLLRDYYGLSGVDTNSVPEIELGATKEDVLTELRRVEARILSDEDKFVHAEIVPQAAGNAVGSFAKIRMELYFDDGKLSTRKDSPEQQISNPK